MQNELTLEDVVKLQTEAGAALLQATTRAIMAERRVVELTAEAEDLRKRLAAAEDMKE